MRYSERLRLDTYLRTFGSVKAMPPLRQPEWHREDTAIYWLAILVMGLAIAVVGLQIVMRVG